MMLILIGMSKVQNITKNVKKKRKNLCSCAHLTHARVGGDRWPVNHTPKKRLALVQHFIYNPLDPLASNGLIVVANHS